MAKKLVYVALLTTCLSYSREVIIIETPILEIIDASGMIKIENVVAFYDTMLLFYEHRYKTKPELTLEELVAFESEGTLPHAFATRALSAVTKKLLELAHPHLKDLRRIKETLEKIIIQWTKQRDRRNSPLLLWSTIEANHEEEFFKENIKTLGDMKIFSQDLISFIHDFIHSCPKSYNRYLEHKTIRS